MYDPYSQTPSFHGGQDLLKRNSKGQSVWPVQDITGEKFVSQLHSIFALNLTYSKTQFSASSDPKLGSNNIILKIFMAQIRDFSVSQSLRLPFIVALFYLFSFAIFTNWWKYTRYFIPELLFLCHSNFKGVARKKLCSEASWGGVDYWSETEIGILLKHYKLHLYLKVFT